jgi:hypothetical protein
VPTANRTIAKFREHDNVVGPALEELKAKMKAILPQEPMTKRAPALRRKTAPERRKARFWAKVRNADVKGCCWPWQGYAKPSGHGLTAWDSKPIHAHRLAWILKRGEIEAGLCVNHKCRDPLCCNPAHLYLGTRADNMFDRWGHNRYRIQTEREDILSTEPEIVTD